MKKNVVAANWKMNKTVSESAEFAKELSKNLLKIKETELILCPPFTSLFNISETLSEAGIKMGGQNMHYAESGAYTGEISATMLKSVNCEFVILGHSERRHVFGETDELIRQKVDAALAAGLKPIVCVGELIEERQAEKTNEVLKVQIEAAYKGLTSEQVLDTIIAYEPVWAIGTGLTASPAQASEAHQYIRKLVAEEFGADVAEKIQILYGGSVKPNNAEELIKTESIDGFLVGGASLKTDSFTEIAEAVENIQ